jgi:hypothetical protein
MNQERGEGIQDGSGSDRERTKQGGNNPGDHPQIPQVRFENYRKAAVVCLREKDLTIFKVDGPDA